MLGLGQIVDVEVERVEVFGIFCRYITFKILVTIPETSWIASYGSCKQFAEVGDKFKVKLLHFDSKTEIFSASIREQYPNPWLSNLTLSKGKEFIARVVRYVDKADRCCDNPGYLVEVLPGSYAMLCQTQNILKVNQSYKIMICESNPEKCSVQIKLDDNKFTEQ